MRNPFESLWFLRRNVDDPWACVREMILLLVLAIRYYPKINDKEILLPCWSILLGRGLCSGEVAGTHRERGVEGRFMSLLSLLSGGCLHL